MLEIIRNYAKAILELHDDIEDIYLCEKIFSDDVLYKFFLDKTILFSDKEIMINKYFTGVLNEFDKNFLIILCNNDAFDLLFEIIYECKLIWRDKHKIATVEIEYVYMPDYKQLMAIKDFICKKHDVLDISFDFQYNPHIIGGLRIRVGHVVYDKTIKTSVKEMFKTI